MHLHPDTLPGHRQRAGSSSPAQAIQVNCYQASAYLLFDVLCSLQGKMLRTSLKLKVYSSNTWVQGSNKTSLQWEPTAQLWMTGKGALASALLEQQLSGDSSPCVQHCAPPGGGWVSEGMGKRARILTKSHFREYINYCNHVSNLSGICPLVLSYMWTTNPQILP